MLVNAPNVATKRYGDVPALDVSASHDPETGAGAVFIVNRSQTETLETELVWQDGAPAIDEVWQMAGDDPKEANSWEEPNRLTAQQIGLPAVANGRATLVLPPLSFTAILTHAA